MKTPELEPEKLFRTRRLVRVLLAVGGLTLAAGLWLDPMRIYLNLLLNSYLLLTLGLAGICFVAIHYAAGATWHLAIKRVPEALTGVVPLGLVGLFAVFILFPELYSWNSEELEAHSFKAFWLDWPFFLARAVLYAAVWMVLIRAIVGHSRRQDVDKSPLHTLANRRLSALFIAAFAVTFWLASFDWIMSLEPHWYSTLFAIYNFAGLFLGGLAAITILVVWLSRRGPLGAAVRARHRHDLGKLIFAFSTFWMYIWFCQYMLIWYANIPEETIYFVRRAEGVRLPLFLTMMALNWVVPFLVLLPQRTKKNPATLVQVSAAILCGRWLDLYIMIFPAFSHEALWFGVWEVGMACGAAGLFIWMFLRTFRKANPVPTGDPLLSPDALRSAAALGLRQSPSIND